MALLSLDPDYPNLKRVSNAARLLKQGRILAYPTDTTYGMGADPFQLKVANALFAETARPSGKPASLLCADLKMLGQYASMSDRAFRAIKHVTPGPYTFILPAKDDVPRGMHGKRKEVGVRISSHPIVQALITALGTPLLNVSARDREGNYLEDAREIESIWGHRLEAILDCGPLAPRESTVIDLVEDTPVILRHGSGDPGPFNW